MKNAIVSDTNKPATDLVATTHKAIDSPRIKAGGAAETEASAVASQTMLERLLAMAQQYRKNGNYRQATELFWTLAENHSETPQADAAKAELLKLADDHERAGSQRVARSMYERLLDMEG